MPLAGLDPLAVEEELALVDGDRHGAIQSVRSALDHGGSQGRRRRARTMGAGIAQVCVQAGVETVRPGGDARSSAERARERIAHYLGRGVEKGRDSSGARRGAARAPRRPPELADLAGCDLRLEAVVEELDAKRALFRELDALVAPEAVLATNTSALSVTDRRGHRAARSGSSACTSSTRRRSSARRSRADRAVVGGRGRDRLRLRRADRQAADPLRRHPGLRRQPASSSRS